LWDMDGTLIDTERLHYQILADLCRREGMQWSWEENKAIMGATMNQKWEYLIARHAFRQSKEQWLNTFNREYIKGLKTEFGLTPQIDAVCRMRAIGLPLGCVSNGENEVVKANLEIIGLAHCFSVVVAGGGNQRGKPFPDPYILACKHLGFHPQKCLAVEDSPLGAQAAVDAGLITVVWPDADSLPWTGPKVHHVVQRDRFPWEILQRLHGHWFSGCRRA
ncbi:MAG: HAD family hydrolase, partial [Pseudomonadota bacterium]